MRNVLLLLASLAIAPAAFASTYTKVLIEDDFSDGEFLNQPTWEVTGGEFRINKENDLSGRVDEGAPFNRIRVREHITNAFALIAEFTLNNHQGPARAMFAVIQDNPERYGYRLRIHGGPESVIELLRTSRHGRATVGRVTLASRIDDGTARHLRWHHSPDDEVVVKLDGQELFRVTDRSFKDPYEKLIVRQNRGLLKLHSIRVKGTR